MVARHFRVPLVGLVLFPAGCWGETRSDYELTMAVARQALRGWRLFESRQFAEAFDGGHYTDTDRATRGRDFWSNGRFAKLDRDNNGHHETIFAVARGELIYVGSIGVGGTLVDVARPYRRYAGKPWAPLRSEIDSKSRTR